MEHMLKRINPFRKIGSLLGVTLIALSLFFYNPVFAETVGGNSPIIGVNINIVDYEYGVRPYQGTVTLITDMTRWQCMSSHSTMGCQVWQSQNTSSTVQDDITGTITYSSTSTYSAYLYEYEFVLDGDYTGYITFSTNNAGATTTKTYYVNGGSFTLTATSLLTTFTVSSYNLISKNTGSMWMFPFESFNFIYFFANNNFRQVGLESIGNYYFPIFDVPQNTQIYRTRIAAGGVHRVIFFIDQYLVESTFSNYITLSDSTLTTTNHRIIRRLMPNMTGATTYVVYSVDIVNNGASAINYNMNYVGPSSKFMPIYYDYPTNDYITTDFALLFGLSNDLLDNLDIIANGTLNSNNAVNSSDDIKNDFDDSASDLVSAENSFNASMNSSLENINTDFSFSSNFGNKFLSSADWVRVQFNNMTNSTPFGSVLGYALLLGIGLLIIGKTLG